MRILFVTYTYPPFLETGGPPLKVKALAEGLADRGHSVTVLTANHARPSRPITRRVSGVEVVYLRSPYRYRFVPVTLGAARAARSRISDCDVVHLFGMYDLMTPAAARVSRRRGVPFVLEPLGMHRAIIRSLMKKRLYQLLIGGRVVGSAERIIATSQREKAELVSEGIPGDRIVLRDNGIDLRPFLGPHARGGFRRKIGISDGELLTLFLGRLATKKHPELLVAAFARGGAPGALAFVGPDEDGNAAKVRDAAADAGIGDRVFVTGPIYDEGERVSAYADADLFVLPSESENFGNSVAEAMAAGTAVVVTDRCGISTRVAGRAGEVVELDEAQISEAIARLLADDSLRAKYGEAGRSIASGLGWDGPLDETERMYEELKRTGTKAVH